MPHKKPIASETDARKMKSFARLGGLKEAPASIGGEYFTILSVLFSGLHSARNLAIGRIDVRKEIRELQEKQQSTDPLVVCGIEIEALDGIDWQ